MKISWETKVSIWWHKIFPEKELDYSDPKAVSKYLDDMDKRNKRLNKMAKLLGVDLDEK